MVFQDTIENYIMFGKQYTPIVILDEATASVYPENEVELQSAIDALTHDEKCNL